MRALPVLACLLVLGGCAGPPHERQLATSQQTTNQNVEIIDAAERLADTVGKRNAETARAAASGGGTTSVTNIYHGPAGEEKLPWFESTGVEGRCFPSREHHDQFHRRAFCHKTPRVLGCRRLTVPCSDMEGLSP